MHIAIVGRMADVEAREWSAMATVPWNVIIDFDTGTDTDGNYALARELFTQRRALRLTALDDAPAITPRSTIWAAAAGLDS